MDLLTDILNSFFVSSNVTKNKNTTVITSDGNNSNSNNTKKTSSSTSSLKTSTREKMSTSCTSSSSSSSILYSKVEEHTLSSVDIDQDARPFIENKVDNKIEKFILKGRDIYKNNIMIVNEDRRDNLIILGDILDRIGKLENINEIYNSKIYIMTSENNMTKYRKMLLENPYLYFMDYDIRKGYYESKDLYEKRTIYIIDYELLSSEKLEGLSKRLDIQLIVVGNVYSSEIGELFKKMGDKRVLINKKSKIQSLQKQFYKNIIKKVCIDDFVNFEEYIKNIDDENLDTRWVIINGDKLMYN